ncbi:FAD-binding-3 domain-containing protein [Fusarium keratoplasticum]|uniref:FAD-binding-3 domain-containing protein n=1 Tax=Fusarium keratoplasticum TaxID=1328300 RepID=A0ACC0QR11_9HYPO|nr:FAD-binding-3 domain-containing protein [Fusarium keratoplasticum]KAI8661051.1 FAD-binding-3 domain-containing protein [Fusarium keratoplasticum]
MAQDPPFKVVIVGASVAGLSLANMLQANDIDFVVLEAYPSIAPQVGASIGLLPHGNRILDQLGLYEKILQVAEPVNTFSFREPSGLPLASYPDMDRNLIDRHGYPMIFLDRQTLIQTLYDNIRDKSKIVANKRVTTVNLGENGVTVLASDASMFQGDILIGADGIHSTVRGEMRRLANMTRPGWFDAGEEEEPPCDYNCIFGISRPCHGIVPGGLHEVFRNGSSYLISGGPNGRVYWFRFEKLSQRLYGTQIPRYSQKELEEALDRASNDPILPGLTFSTLVENRITAVLTHLPEYVYKKWHFGRAFTLGDSAHKLHPIGGHGGNAAIETAAALTNSLVDLLEKASSPLATTDITTLFNQVQTLRYPRVMAIKAYSHKKQLTESLDNSLQRLVALRLLPRVREQDVTRSYSAQIPASEKLNMLPLPYRKKLVPYKDELVAKPKARGTVRFIILGIYLTCSAVAFYLRWLSPSATELGNQINKVLAEGALEDDSLTLLQRARTGIPLIGDRVAFMAAAFVPGLRNPTQQLGCLQLYSLSQSLHPIMILTLEGFRGHFAVSVLTWYVLIRFPMSSLLMN